MIQFKYYNEGATFDASLLNNEDIAFVEDENALYTHGKKFKFADPTPIPAEGDVLVFNDAECTEYFDGQSNICYVRLNNGLDFNGARTWGEESQPAGFLSLGAPSEEFPTDGYGIMVYAKDIPSGQYYLKNPYAAGPYAAGSVHRLVAPEGMLIDNPVTIFPNQ